MSQAREPKSPAQLRDEMLLRIEDQAGSLTGIALVQAYKALNAIALEEERGADSDDGGELSLLDLLDSTEEQMSTEMFDPLAQEIEDSLVAQAERLQAIRERRRERNAE